MDYGTYSTKRKTREDASQRAKKIREQSPTKESEGFLKRYTPTFVKEYIYPAPKFVLDDILKNPDADEVEKYKYIDDLDDDQLKVLSKIVYPNDVKNLRQFRDNQFYYDYEPLVNALQQRNVEKLVNKFMDFLESENGVSFIKSLAKRYNGYKYMQNNEKIWKPVDNVWVINQIDDYFNGKTKQFSKNFLRYKKDKDFNKVYETVLSLLEDDDKFMKDFVDKEIESHVQFKFDFGKDIGYIERTEPQKRKAASPPKQSKYGTYGGFPFPQQESRGRTRSPPKTQSYVRRSPSPLNVTCISVELEKEIKDVINMFNSLERGQEDTFKILKRKFRKITTKIHPDKTLDEPKEVVSKCTKYFNEITQAYNSAIDKLGMKVGQ